MYAIVRVGGHQEKVSPGERIVIDRVKTEVGGTLNLTPLMVADDGNTITDHAELHGKASVVATVVEHIRGDKIDASRYQSKTGFRKRWGHRQALTVVEIAEITFGDKSVKGEEAKAVAAEAKEAEGKAAAEKREAVQRKREEAKKAVAAKKSAAKKTAGTAKTAAKKSPAKKTAQKKTAPKKK